MGNDSFIRVIRNKIAILFWRAYVRLYWDRNRSVQIELTDNIGKNLGFYLNRSEPFNAGKKR